MMIDIDALEKEATENGQKMDLTQNVIDLCAEVRRLRATLQRIVDHELCRSCNAAMISEEALKL